MNKVTKSRYGKSLWQDIMCPGIQKIAIYGVEDYATFRKTVVLRIVITIACPYYNP